MKSSCLFRIAAVLFAAAMLLPLAACAPAENGVPAGMVRASAEFAQYDLFVPDSWNVSFSGGAVSAYRSESDPTSVYISSYALPYTDSTVEDWWEGYVDEFSLVFSDFDVTETETTVLDGVAAVKYVYTGTLAENTYRYTQYAAAKGGAIYLLLFTELADTDIDHSAEFSSIVENFAWKE